MKYFRIFLIAILGVVGLSKATYAQTPTWVSNIGGVANDITYVIKVAPVSGNVCIAGKFTGTMDLDPGVGVTNVTSNGLEDIFLACYSASGSFLWGGSIGGASYDAATNMTINANDEVIICGYYRGIGVDFDPGPGTLLMNDAGVTGALTYNGDGFVAKFSAAGVFQWAKSLGGSTVNDVANDVAVDGAFNVYVCGRFNNIMVVSPTITWNSALTGRGYIIKYNNAGSLIWADAFGLTGAADNECAPLSIDVKGGSIYHCGNLQGTAAAPADMDPGPAVSSAVAVGTSDGYIAKLDTAGNYIESIPLSGLNNTDIANCLIVLNNRLYVSGYTNSAGMSFYGASGSSNFAPAAGGGFDFFLCQYDTALQFNTWSFLTGGTGDDICNSIEIKNNRLYATGSFQNLTDFDPSGATFNMTSAGNNDIFVSKYYLTGGFLCAFKVGGAGDDIGYGIALNPLGELYNSGMFSGGPVDFNPGTGVTNLTSTGASDCYMVNYSLFDTLFRATITGDSVCPGLPGTVTLNVTSGFTGPITITLSNGTSTNTYSGVFSGIPFNITPTPTVTSRYYVTDISYPGANLCYLPAFVSLDTADLTVSTVSASISSTMLGCNNVSLSSVTTGSGYSWVFGDGNTSTLNALAHVYTTAGTYSVVLTVSDTLACSVRDTAAITILPAPNVFIGNDTTFCSGDSILLHSTFTYPATATYGWSNGTTGTSIYADTTGVFWMTVTIGACTSSDSVHITVNASPTVLLGNDTAFCIGSSTTLYSHQDTSSTYLWSTGSTDTSLNVFANGTYWLTVFNGCYTTDSIHITVSPLPIVNLGPDSTSCQGLAVLLQSSGSYVAPIYLWNDATTGPMITASSAGTYWLQVTDIGCTRSDTITIGIVTDTLTLHNVDTAVCKGSIVQGFASANPGATYQWLPTAGVPSSNILNAVITPDTSGVYYIYSYMTGCPPIYDSFYIEVQPNPSVFLGGNRTVCQFDTLHIHASVSPDWFSGYTYSWSPTVSLDYNTTQNVVYTAGGNQNYIVTVRTSAGCWGQDSALIAVQPGNFATISGDRSICPLDSVQFTGGGGATYRWYPSIYLDDSVSATPWVHPIASQSYTMVATSAVGCTDTLSVNVVVYPNAVVFVGDSVMIYPGESYQLDAYGNCTSFSWFPTAGLSGSLIANPVATPGTDTKYIITAITDDGCVAMDSVNIYVNSETILKMPNAFAPGTEGNNKFYVMRKGLANLNFFRIFNRWGNLMFETKDINAGWDGNYKGEPQPFGVYVYEMQAVTTTGNIVTKNGNLTLIR